MADGAAGFRQGFSGPALLRIQLCDNLISNTRLSRPTAGLSRPFFYLIVVNVAVLQPPGCRNTPGLGCSAFARRYLRNHCCFLFLRVLRCFSSPRSPHIRGNTPSGCWVPPFGNPGIWGCLLLPRAYRSLPRPSSPLRAKASPVRPRLTFSSRVIKLYLNFSRTPTQKREGARALRLILGFLATPSQGPLSSFLYVLFPNMSKASRAFRAERTARGLPRTALSCRIGWR